MAEAFVKIFKGDYVYVNDRPDARTVLGQLAAWFEDYIEMHPRLEGQSSDINIQISGLDETAINSWLNTFKDNNNWETLGQNCSTVAAKALTIGGWGFYSVLGGDYLGPPIWR